MSEIDYKIDAGCIPMFALILPKGTVIYKGFKNMNTVFNHNSKEPCWFALRKEQSMKYGDNIQAFKTTTPIKLINISSTLFKSHFTDQINMALIDPIDKENILMTLGIPNARVQNEIIQKNTTVQNLCTISKQLQNQVDYYNGSRYSGTNLDMTMVFHIEKLYGQHISGYMQPRPVPSCWHREFPEELCIFNVSKHVLTRVNSPTAGGSIVKERKYLAPREVSHEDFVNMRCEILRKQLYSKEVIEKFRKSGALKWPKLRFLVGPTSYDIGGPVIDRMPDF